MIDQTTEGFVPEIDGYSFSDSRKVYISNHAIDRVSQRFLDEFRRETGNGETMGLASWIIDKVREAHAMNNINKRGHYLIEGMILVINDDGKCLTLTTVLYP